MGSELNRWWRAGLLIVPPLLRLALRLRFRGLERIPTRGPAILACNHVSVLDGIALAIAPAAERGRAIRFLIAAEVFRNRFFGFFLRRLRQIPIRRGGGDTGALDDAVRTTREGALVAIFPEGRVGEGTELQRGRTGAARVALASGAPVIPAGIWGTQLRWPRSGLSFRRPLRPTAVLAFGDPIEPAGDPLSVEDVQAFTDLVMEGIAKQVKEARAAAEHR